MNQAINQLSTHSWFDLVGYNINTYIWKSKAVKATPVNKQAAIAWIDTLPIVEAHILLDAGVTTINISNISPVQYKRLIFVGNITPQDAEAALTGITAANFQNTPLDTIYIPDPHFPPADSFWQSLAAANGGKYTFVP